MSPQGEIAFAAFPVPGMCVKSTVQVPTRLTAASGVGRSPVPCNKPNKAKMSRKATFDPSRDSFKSEGLISDENLQFIFKLFCWLN